MAYEVLLLVGAALFFLLDLFLMSKSKTNNNQKTKYGFLVPLFGFVLIIASYLVILAAFLRNDFSFVGVYSYSSSSVSALSKLYSSWAGAGGSMLFLTIMLSTAYLCLRITALRKPDKFKITTSQLFCFVLLVFIIVTLLMNPYETLSIVPSEGRGLNPQLQSIWMAIHPPIVFSAYTFIVLAFVLTLASIKTGRDIESSNLLNGSTYAGWILLTLGIALGGVWAYEVLGWGGYWAWDPVETASLLPWLLLTAYFVVREISKNKSLTRELMIMLTFSSLVLLSALTRGGFKQSVHSYAVSAVGPVMLSFAASMVVYFFYLKKNRRLSLFNLDVNKESLTSRSHSLGFWALILISVVCLIGLGFTNFSYSSFTFPFVLLFVISLIGLSFNEKTHYARLILVVAIGLGIGAALAAINFLNLNPLASLCLPLLVIAFASLFLKLLKTIKRKSLNLFGQSLLSLAIIILLLGVFVSAGAKTTTTIENVAANVPAEALGLKIQFSNLAVANSSEIIFNEQTGTLISEHSTIQATVAIQQSEKAYSGTLEASFYPNYGLVLKPLIITTETGDIYLHFDLSDSLYNTLVNIYVGNTTIPETVSITVQKSPLIYLVWSGVALMLAGMSFQIVSCWKPRNSVKHFS
jgi:cytochrome c biogenesis factor